MPFGGCSTTVTTSETTPAPCFELDQNDEFSAKATSIGLENDGCKEGDLAWCHPETLTGGAKSIALLVEYATLCKGTCGFCF